MSAITTDLMGAGVPAAQATLLGHLPAQTIAGSGTAQKTDSAAATSGNLLPGQGMVNATTSAGQTALQIPSTMPLGAEIVLNVTTATAALLFPPSGGTINGGAANASVSIAQNKPTLVRRITSTIFVAVIGS
jgi:hypothetical protein